MFALRKRCREFAVRNSAAEVIALHLVATCICHAIKLGQRFHTLGHRANSQRPRKSRHGIHDCYTIFAVEQVSDVRSVNLDLVEGKVAQIAKRPTTPAKLVKRRPDAAFSQLGQDLSQRSFVPT